MVALAVILTNVAIWLFSTLVLVPIETYYGYQIYDNRDSLVIAKRKPGILLISVGSAMIFYFLFQTILLILSIAHISVLDDLSIILYYVILPVWYTSWFTFIVRLYLLYFTIQHSVATINNQWQEVICKHHKINNYYLKYKKTLGTWTGLRRKIIIYALCTYINDIILGALLLKYDNNTTAQWALILTLGVIKASTSTLIPMGFLVYMLYHINKCHFHDNIGLGRELRFCTYGYLLILVIRLVDFTVSSFAARDEEEQQIVVSFIVAIEFLLWKLVGFAINLLQTRWPLKTFGKIMSRYSTRHLGKLAHAKTLKNVESSNQSSKNESLRMKQLLQNEKSFDLFMSHCASEHATECVLSIIEFIQYKTEIYKKLSMNGRSDQVINEMELDQSDTFSLPANCPKSDIVFSKNKNFKQIALALYVKYIAVGSDWEINLDYHSRRKYQRLFENDEIWLENKEYSDNVKLYQIFDKCLMEMTNLVRAAFSRFKQTDSFMVLQQKSKSIKKLSTNYGDEEEDEEDDEEDDEIENLESIDTTNNQ